ncbi:MAG: ubiquitin-like domain-containing protein [Pseudonocardia sp.]|nr:ubiquitin-like domain-containing protein [Pseudonocardia sp.]
MTVDGQERIVHTFARDVAGALASAGIAALPGAASSPRSAPNRPTAVA